MSKRKVAKGAVIWAMLRGVWKQETQCTPPHSHAQVVRLGLGSRLALDELSPCLVALVDDLDGVLLGLCLAREGKDVLM